jgi:hypothetical protein
VKAYKFLTADGRGLFSRFAWPAPGAAPGQWIEADVAPCTAGIHACRRRDLSYWVSPVLYEIELDGPVSERATKVVAPRGRLVRRIDTWNEQAREEYSQMCIARAAEIAASAPGQLGLWAPSPDGSTAGPALMGYVAARVAEAAGGVEAYTDERARQSHWLADRLGLD